MSALSLASPFPIFTDIDGNPLEDGYIYVGTAGLNPETNSISTYWDAALTVPAAQPIRTSGGYPFRNGTAARIYVNADDCSILVKNKNGSLIFSTLNQTERLPAALIAFTQDGVNAVPRTVATKLQEFVSVKDFGAVGDGVTDDLVTLNTAIASHRVISVPGTGSYLTDSDQNGWILPSDTTLIGNGQATLAATTLNYRPLAVDAETTRPDNVNILGVKLSNNSSNTNDWAPLRLGGVKGGLVAFNHTVQSFFGMTFGASIYNDKTEVRSSDLRAIGNLSQGLGAGYEVFSLKNSAFVGNVAYNDGVKGASHGFRVTGYGAAQAAPGTDQKTYGFASAGNSANNYAQGISQQLGVYGSSYAGYALTGCTTGISMPVNDTSANDQSKGNTYVGIAISDGTNGVRLEKTEKHVLSALAIRNTTNYGVGALVASSASTHGTGKYNRIDGLIADYTGSAYPALIECSNSRIDLTIADIGSAYSRGCKITGNYNVVTITGGGATGAAAGQFLEIAGAGNIVIIAADNIAQTSQEIYISGNNNTLIASLDSSDGGGKVNFAVGVTGNTLIGNFIFTAAVPVGNRIDSVFSSGAQGSATGTTNVSGDLTVSYPWTLVAGTVSLTVSQTNGAGAATTPYHLHTHSRSSTGFKVRATTMAGAAATGVALTINYIAAAIT